MRHGAPKRSMISVRFSILLLVAGLLTQAGCVALNIPSERIHDPVDGGGLFGHWRNRLGSQGQAPIAGHSAWEHHSVSGSDWPEGLIESGAAGGGCLDCGGYLDGGPDGVCLDCEQAASKRKEPEVPWPRFHPVPTRPVFGPPPL